MKIRTFPSTVSAVNLFIEGLLVAADHKLRQENVSKKKTLVKIQPHRGVSALWQHCEFGRGSFHTYTWLVGV